MYVVDNLSKYNLKAHNPQVTTLDILVLFSLDLPVFIKESDRLCLTDCFQGELERILIDALGVGGGFHGHVCLENAGPGGASLGLAALPFRGHPQDCPGRGGRAPLGGLGGPPRAGPVRASTARVRPRQAARRTAFCPLCRGVGVSCFGNLLFPLNIVRGFCIKHFFPIKGIPCDFFSKCSNV